MTGQGSRLVLGTAQLGGVYGVANVSGPPDPGLAREMVATALAGGITTFDTAAAYGRSERILGRALAELGAVDRAMVVTKIAPLTDADVRDPATATRAVAASVDASRSALGLDTLPLVLFHREADAVHLPALQALRERGIVGRIGVSVDHLPGPAARFCRAGVDAVQLPFSVLDGRHLGTFAVAQASGTTVFVRSVLLQGLVLMPEAAIPAHLRAVLPARRAVHRLAAEAGMTPAELAVRYALSQRGDVRVLVGAETVDQVHQAVVLGAAGPLSGDLTQRLAVLSEALPDSVRTPSSWPGMAASDERGGVRAPGARTSR